MSLPDSLSIEDISDYADAQISDEPAPFERVAVLACRELVKLLAQPVPITVDFPYQQMVNGPHPTPSDVLIEIGRTLADGFSALNATLCRIADALTELPSSS